MSDSTRRDFLKIGGSALAGAAFLNIANAQDTRPAASSRGQRAGGREMGSMASPHAKMTHANMMAGMIPGATNENGEWVLPPLPYSYDALEPHIDAQTMQLHHDIHHQGYVNGLKKSEEKLAQICEGGDAELLEYWLMEASFNGGGHFLHCVFWESMSPQGGGQPEGLLLEHIERDFGSFDSFKSYFGSASKKVEGSGWGVLAYQIASGNLTVMQARNHNLLSQWGLVPLMCIDVWEHAYYLKYQNKRADYVDNWWNVVDWNAIERRHAMLHGVSEAVAGQMHKGAMMREMKKSE